MLGSVNLLRNAGEDQKNKGSKRERDQKNNCYTLTLEREEINKNVRWTLP